MSAVVDLGLIVGAFGAVLLAIGAGRFLARPSNATASNQRWWQLTGAIFIGAGFAAQLAGRV
jgi:hypothetical protein